MSALDAAWWIGWAYFVSWTLSPVLIIAPTSFTGLLLCIVLAPWTALAGMAALHATMPHGRRGHYTLFADRGSILWAVRGWAPSLYLTVFQPVCFTCNGFQRLILRAFGARIGADALMTSRTVAREPHRLQIGARTLIGEYAHLVCSFQPRPRLLIVADIVIGADTLVGAHSVIGAGSRIGDRCVLEFGVVVSSFVDIGDDSRLGAQTTIHAGARIGARVRIGKRCLVTSGAVVPDDTVVADNVVVRAS
jgi:acetyltransferase-like isoleucine patch superfamily enzyme